jgi:hypothetical protein
MSQDASSFTEAKNIKSNMDNAYKSLTSKPCSEENLRKIQLAVAGLYTAYTDYFNYIIYPPQDNLSIRINKFRAKDSNFISKLADLNGLLNQ